MQACSLLFRLTIRLQHSRLCECKALLGLWVMGPMQEPSWSAAELLLWPEEEGRCRGIRLSASPCNSPPPAASFLFRTTPEATRRTAIDGYKPIIDGDPEAERRKDRCLRSQDKLAKEQSRVSRSYLLAIYHSVGSQPQGSSVGPCSSLRGEGPRGQGLRSSWCPWQPTEAGTFSPLPLALSPPCQLHVSWAL